MKHTPGPWTLDVPNYDTSFVFTIYGPNGEFIADTCHSTSMDRDKHARLIAAAPELLARLELAVRYLEHPDVQAIPFAGPAAGCAELCRAAIAKATG